jgi:hypothetical protein
MRIGEPCGRPAGGRQAADAAVAAIGDPHRTESDGDVLGIAADGDPPAGHDVLARVDAGDGAVPELTTQR